MKIAALVSGGVDSSVALGLLSRLSGHKVTAFYLKIWLEDELAFLGQCPWEEDLKYVQAVCQQFNVPLQIVNLQSEYYELVVSYTIEELKAGRTPSPDIFCNQRIKFGAFLERIGAEFDAVCSGHYARIQKNQDSIDLLQAIDPVKDQSYFLSHLSQTQLTRCLFPIGELMKSEVRVLAREMNLPNQSRPDSQGICFLGKIKYNEFVKFHLGESAGSIVDADSGKLLGQHRGYWYHTVGQRKGLRLSGGPWFVTGKDVETNTIFVSHDSSRLNQAPQVIELAKFNWINNEAHVGSNYQCKLRHGPKTVQCLIESKNKDRVTVRLSEPDSGIAPGQFCILYDQAMCLGGGVIDKV